MSACWLWPPYQGQGLPSWLPASCKSSIDAFHVHASWTQCRGHWCLSLGHRCYSNSDSQAWGFGKWLLHYDLNLLHLWDMINPLLVAQITRPCHSPSRPRVEMWIYHNPLLCALFQSPLQVECIRLFTSQTVWSQKKLWGPQWPRHATKDT